MAPPGPIPNPEVKRIIANGSAGIARVRVGCCQFNTQLFAKRRAGFFIAYDLDFAFLIFIMPRRLDHIDLRVPNLKQAEPFYSKLLPALGFTRAADIGGWLQFNAETGETTSEFFGMTENSEHVPNHYRFAFWATSNEEVDRLAKLLHYIGALNIEGPGFDEGPTYYAVFFEDPFGNRLEICHRTQN